MIKTIEEYHSIINSIPNPSLLKTNPDGSAYLPISIIQNQLDEIFGSWNWDLTRETVGRRMIICKGTLQVFHPIHKGMPITKSGTAAVIRSNNINDLKLDYPKAESMAILNAAKKLGRYFGRDLNRDKDDAPVAVIQIEDKLKEAEITKEFNNIKERLEAAKTYKAASDILNTSTFKFNPDLIKIVNEKNTK